jgi:hypothetical protein
LSKVSGAVQGTTESTDSGPTVAPGANGAAPAAPVAPAPVAAAPAAPAAPAPVPAAAGTFPTAPVGNIPTAPVGNIPPIAVPNAAAAAAAAPPVPPVPPTATPPGTPGVAAPGQTAQQAAAQQTATKKTATPPRPAAPAPSGRRVRLTVARVDPWSVMKISFLVSVAIGIAFVVMVAVLWLILDGMGVFSSLNRTIADIQGTTSDFDLMDYIALPRVMSLSVVIGVIDVVLLTALSTLAAFLHNVCSSLVGGVQLTLSDD